MSWDLDLWNTPVGEIVTLDDFAQAMVSAVPIGAEAVVVSTIQALFPDFRLVEPGIGYLRGDLFKIRVEISEHAVTLKMWGGDSAASTVHALCRHLYAQLGLRAFDDKKLYPFDRYPEVTYPESQAFHDALTSLQEDEPVIYLRRHGCLGACPSYTVSIYGDGRVVYEGFDWVGTLGIHKSQISHELLKNLIFEFFKIDYFALQDRYTDDITDMPGVITSLSINGRTKQVYNYATASQILTDLEEKIDLAVNTAQWVDKQPRLRSDRLPELMRQLGYE